MDGSRFRLFERPPVAVAMPATTEEAQEIARQSAGQAVVPWGGGGRQHIGYAPERYDLALSTERLNAIVDYQPADMTVTAEAGVTISVLQETLARNGQFLPVDVAQPERQTVGGVVAARADSLRRWQYGSVRDSLIGVTVVNSLGERIKGGGRVVKNVAGYDLPKLYCGSFGTLGLITEATFKVSPLPEAAATVVLPLDAGRNSEDALDHLLGSELTPSFLYLISPLAALAILPAATPDAQYLVIGFDGPRETVDWQLQALGAQDGALSEADAAFVRAGLRDFALADAPMVAAFHILSSQIGAFARMVEWTARRAGFDAHVVADAAVGNMWASFAPARGDADWRVFYADLHDKAIRCGGSFIIERMPLPLREADTPVWLPLLPDFPLMARLKETLDPQRMWNPGRFVGRI